MTQSPPPPDTPSGESPSPSSRPPVDPRGVATAPVPPPGYAPPVYAAPSSRGNGWIGRTITSLAVTLLILSIVLNLYLGFMVNALTAGPTESIQVEGDASQRIVVLPIEGLIDDRKAQFVQQALQQLRNNPPRALILRVDSGGGFVAPSDQIWHQLEQFLSDVRIPMIASFGATAASGGYYVAASSDVIIAEPTTMTGSIGVIAQAFTFDRLLDKIGVTPEVIASTESTRKDMLNPMRPWTEADRDKLRNVLDNAYDRFVHVIHQGRGPVANLSLDEIKAVATGEVFTVDEAIARRLVDREGYLEDAIQEAASKAGLAAGVQPQVTVIQPQRAFGIGGLLGSASVPRLDEVSAEQIRSWVLEFSVPRLMFQFGGGALGQHGN